MEDAYEVSIFVKVTDVGLLWDAALAIGIFDEDFDEASAPDHIGTRDVPDVEGCLQMILDPGFVPDAGFEIEESTAEMVMS